MAKLKWVTVYFVLVVVALFVFFRYHPALMAAPGYELQNVTEPGWWNGRFKTIQAITEQIPCTYTLLGWQGENTLYYEAACAGTRHVWRYTLSDNAPERVETPPAALFAEPMSPASIIDNILADVFPRELTTVSRGTFMEGDVFPSPNGRFVALISRHVYGPQDVLLLTLPESEAVGRLAAADALASVETAVSTAVPIPIATATPVPQITPEPTQPLRIPTVTPTRDYAPSDEWETFNSPQFGISLRHPAGWTAVALPNQIAVVHPETAVSLKLTVRPVAEEISLARSGVSAGELVPRNPIIFIGQPVSSDVLVYLDKDKAVFYDGAGEVTRDALVFAITLESNSPDYESIMIPEAVQLDADAILSTVTFLYSPLALERVGEVDLETFIVTQAPTIPLPPSPDPATVWSTDVFSSTNGVWTAVSTSFNPIVNSHRQLFLVGRRDAEAAWQVVDEMENWGLGVGVYAPVHWSADGEQLAFTYRAVPDGCGAGGTLGWGLWQFDLQNGQIEQVVPERGFPLMAISPDESQWVIRTQNGFRLLNVTTRTAQDFSISSVTGGGIDTAVWSPDGAHLLLIQADTPCAFSEREYTFIHVDLVSVEAWRVTAVNTKSIQNPIWLDANIIQFQSLEPNGEWELDIVTGRLSVNN